MITIYAFIALALICAINIALALRYKHLWLRVRAYNTELLLSKKLDFEPIDMKYLVSKGFVKSGMFFVKKSTPRIGYNPDTKETIVGYVSIGNMIRTRWQMESLLKSLLIWK